MKKVSIIFGMAALLVVVSFLPGYTQHSVSGMVKDARTGEGLVNANVILPGSKKGVSTNYQGNYKISGLMGPSVELKFSYLGYHDTTLTVVLDKDRVINVALEADSMEMTAIVVTATRTRQAVEDIPGRVNTIGIKTIEEYPAINTDDLLKMIPGIVVNRSWGIFSRNAAVTMRGMPGSSRSLILLDGIPLNKTAGGTVSWHLVTPDEIERIEVVKGPASTLYGNNAMGGVINIITKHPEKQLQGSAGIGYGTYNTMQGEVNLLGRNFKENKGMYWKLGSFYRQGDGYILAPGDQSDSINSKAFLKEGNFNGMIGYRFGTGHKLELDYRFYKDKRGSGVKVYEKDGSYESFTNNNARLGYERFIGKMKLNLKAFYLNEQYYRQNENVNQSGEYKLVDTDSEKHDFGVWITLSRPVGEWNHITAGIDVKDGILDNHEIYRTSTDDITTFGNLLFAGLFFQDEMDMIRDKLLLTLGARVDHARFYKGGLEVLNPTSKTGFPMSMNEEFPENSWTQFSPKVALKYIVQPDFSTYISASNGFMPPRLDDLAGSRKIRRGFKEANPELTPETLNSLEWGFDWTFKKLSVKPSVYYSLGKDFQYLVATGDFIDSGSDDPVPVYQRQNVSKVEVIGAEGGIEYRPVKSVKATASYAYNHSRILDYKASANLDLTGKFLNEVPANMMYLGVNWENKIFDVFINYTFTDEQWYDEENTEIVESYSLVNLRLSKILLHRLQLSLDVQDLLDSRFIDRKGYLSPGRFFLFEIKYLINK